MADEMVVTHERIGGSNMWRVWIVLAYFLMGSIVVTGLFIRDRDLDRARVTTAAVCEFRADLETRYERGREFLRDNPQGIPGIPASVLRRSIEQQRDTLDSLQKLDAIC